MTDPTIVPRSVGPPLVRTMPAMNVPLLVEIAGHFFQGDLRMTTDGVPYFLFKEYETTRGAGGDLKITLLDARKGRKLEYDQNDSRHRA